MDKWEGVVQTPPARYNLKLFADKETYEAMDELAKLQNKNAHQLAIEVIRNFVASQQNGKSERVIWETIAAASTLSDFDTISQHLERMKSFSIPVLVLY